MWCTVCPKFRHSLPSRSCCVPHESVLHCWDAVIGHALRATAVIISQPVVLHSIWLNVDITSIPVHFDELWLSSIRQNLIHIVNPELLLRFPRKAMFVTKFSLWTAAVQLLCEFACFACVLPNIRAHTWCHSYSPCPKISGIRATLRV